MTKAAYAKCHVQTTVSFKMPGGRGGDGGGQRPNQPAMNNVIPGLFTIHIDGTANGDPAFTECVECKGEFRYSNIILSFIAQKSNSTVCDLRHSRYNYLAPFKPSSLAFFFFLR